MGIPRLEIDTNKIAHNAMRMKNFCRTKGVELTAVTKGVGGAPRVAEVFLNAGIASLGDSRLVNLKRLRSHGIHSELVLIRSPLLSEVAQVVTFADASLNTELEVVRRLNLEAGKQGKIHSVLLMVELGDLREGVTVDEVGPMVESIRKMRSIRLHGLGANLSCLSGLPPSPQRLEDLSRLSERIQDRLGVSFQRLSGGNSSNYQWMKTTSDLGTVNHVRIGESILLGCDSVSHEPLEGFATDAFTLVTEVIEVREKVVQGRAMRRGILALGWQDVDINTVFSSGGLPILGATSDHLVVDASGQDLQLGEEVSFSVGYRAMMGAMASPYVEKVYRDGAVA